MKKYVASFWLIAFTILISSALVSSATCLAQSGYITKWKDNKQAAVNITFDDNLANQFTFALPQLNSRNLPATFFVITSTVNWSQAQALVNSSHEVGSHTVTHPHLRLLGHHRIRTGQLFCSHSK